MAKQPQNLYDEDLDQPIAAPDHDMENDGKDDATYKTFLAPKAAFAGKDLDVGAVHRVKIVRALDEELELRCIEKKDDDDNDEDKELYE